ncbi:response regulator transcription factor [Sphaerotilus sp.]|uniref:response regulator transcription factor n=1 Tax=Sphaerotilus sp. TaxID=2093942 RepID=UPI0025E50C3D|nr:response regulator transcription factor [Sphaerotilus sp.]
MTTPRIRLLIVDDHAVVRDGLKAVFSLVDDLDVVAEAGNGAEAMACARQHDPDVVLMDIGMRGENGIELAARLIDENPERAVLMLTMHDGVEHAQRALKAGARGYVLKDSRSAEIVGAIRTVHGGGTYLSPSVAQALFRAPQARPMLSDREQQILTFLGQGHPSKVIASALDLSVRTVESHRQSIRRKLNLAGQAELIKYAVEHAGRSG